MTADRQKLGRAGIHLRWFFFYVFNAGVWLALALVFHLLVLVPRMLTDSGKPVAALLALLGASNLVALLAGLPIATLAALWHRRRKRPVLVAAVYRAAVAAVPCALVGMAWVQFHWFEGRLDAVSVVALIASAAGTLGAAGALATLAVRGRPADTVPSWSWAAVSALSIGSLVIPPSEVRWPPASTTRTAAERRTHDDDAPAGRQPQDNAQREAASTVLLITVDTLRADHMGIYDYGRDTTPVLDRLGAEGVVVERLVAASSCTIPSTATILTGLHPWCSGVTDQFQPVADDAVTLAETMQAAGYRTLGVVANYLLREANGFAQGFDRFETLLGETQGHATADEVSEHALALIDRGEGPLFVWVHYMDPHYPYLPPENLVEPFMSDGLYEQRFLPVIRFGSRGGVRLDRTTTGEPHSGRVDGGLLLARYDGEIRRLDQGVARLLEGLRKRGRLDDTALAFTADHGEGLMEHGQLFDHCQEVYDTTTRVPAIFWRPSMVEPRRTNRPGAHVDIAPTLLSLAGVAEAQVRQGIDLLHTCNEPSVDRSFHTQTGLWDGLATRLVGRSGLLPIRAVEQDGWKYVLYPRHEITHVRGPLTLIHSWRALLSGIWQPDELYHVAEDPSESNNLAEAQSGRAARMRAHARAYPGVADMASCPLDPSTIRRLTEQEQREHEDRLRSLGYAD